MKKRAIAPFVGTLSIIFAGNAFATADESGAGGFEMPSPITALEREGLTFHETFEVEGELTGYAMSMQGQPVPVFVTQDGQRAIIGTMIDGQGNDLAQAKIEQIILGPTNKAAWESLQNHDVVVEGEAGAPNVMYTITDPNCHYCHQQWLNSRPLVEAGELQVRHVMVGMLAADSVGKSAAILQADDPVAALVEHQESFDEGGIAPADDINPDVQQVIDEGMQLMSEAQVSGTPASFYMDADGQVQRIGGAVHTEELMDRFGIAM